MSALAAGQGLPRHGADAVVAERPAALARVRSFHTLDALRGVAAIGVLLFHAAFFFGMAPPAEGYLAVDLFFVMSGFIIAYRYDADLTAGMGVARFFGTRLVRLYPLFLLGTVLGALPALVSVATGHGDPAHRGLAESLPLALLMLPSRLALPHLGEAYPLNYVSWSLALEILVNLAYAASFRIWTTRRLTALVAAAFVALCVAAWRYGSLDVGFDWANYAGGFARIAFGFSAGILVYRLHAVRPFAWRVPWWLVVALVPALLFLDPRGFHVPGLAPIWDVAVVALVVPAIVVAAIANEPPKAACGACALAGTASYVLYSLHAPFVGLFLRAEQGLHLDVATTSLVKAIVFTMGLAALCTVAHLTYDKPLRRHLLRLRASRAGRPARSSLGRPDRKLTA